ncbi:MAG: succinate dehydrogenase / fumarate reductase cytochrome b subunit, partial [Bacteroidia bacterium]
MSKLSTISRKILMALSGFFLMFFLLQHFTINILSIVNPDAFNEVSQFMGTNFLVQAVLQPVLMFGIIFHFVMAFILEIQNRKARPIGYFAASTSGGKKVSKNMIYSGIAILLFMGLHLYDFWVHEMIVKYGQGDMTGLNAN